VANSIFIGPGVSISGSTVTLQGTALAWPSGTTLTESASGVLTLTGTTPMLQLGGTTSSFPAWKANGSNIEARKADDSTVTDISGGNLLGQLGYKLGGSSVLLVSATAPTISSGFGTSPSIANNNGTASFVVNVGTGGAATNGVIGMPAATTGWIAFCIDLTAAAGHTGLRTVQTASATNSITIESQNSAGAATAWASGSLVRVIALAY
jgi:hypothetical protein